MIGSLGGIGSISFLIVELKPLRINHSVIRRSKIDQFAPDSNTGIADKLEKGFASSAMVHNEEEEITIGFEGEARRRRRRRGCGGRYMSEVASEEGQPCVGSESGESSRFTGG